MYVRPKQIRRLKQLRQDAPADHHRYLFHLIELFKAAAAAGRPVLADDLIPMYHEEFGL